MNWGDSEGYVERIEFQFVVVEAGPSWLPRRSSVNQFDLSANHDEGVRCWFDPGWDPIPADQEVVRTIRLGLEDDGQTIGRSLQLKITVAGENVRSESAIISVDVVGTSTASPAIEPECTQG